MPRGILGRLPALALAALAWAGLAGTSRAQCCATFGTPCASGTCQTLHCPPWFHHCQERPPVICIHCGCPRPVCNPCNLPNFGYFQTCWTPWPLPPDWSHCNRPVPAAYVQLQGPLAMPGTPGTPAGAPERGMGPRTPASSGSGAAAIAPPGDTPETFPQPMPLPPGAPSKTPR
jgi:hypothetical protein